MKTSTISNTFRILPFLLPLVLLTRINLDGQILFFEGFETEGLGSRYFATDAFSDGADDYFIRTDGSVGATGIPDYTGYEGNYYWAAEDTDASDNPSGLALLDFTPIELGEFTAIRISLEIAAGSPVAFDSIDDFVFVQYRVDSGSWNTALAFQNDGTTFNSTLQQDIDMDGIGDGTVLDLSLQSFSSYVLPIHGDLLDLRIDTALTGGSEAVAFDSIQVTGVPEPAHAAFVLGILTILFLLFRRKFLPQREIESRA